MLSGERGKTRTVRAPSHTASGRPALILFDCSYGGGAVSQGWLGLVAGAIKEMQGKTTWEKAVKMPVGEADQVKGGGQVDTAEVNSQG